jgi:antitoxin VapB
MALNIKDPEAERLATEVAGMTGESKTAAVRTALRERKDRLDLASGSGHSRLLRWLEEEVWPNLPPEAGIPLTKKEEEALLGYDEYDR